MTSVEIKGPFKHSGNGVDIITQQFENFNLNFCSKANILGSASELYKEKRVKVNCTESKNAACKNESDARVEIINSTKVKSDSKKDKGIKTDRADQAEGVVSTLSEVQAVVKNKNDKEKEKLKGNAEDKNDVMVKFEENIAVISEKGKNKDNPKKVLTLDGIEGSKSQDDEDDLENDSDTEQCNVIPRGGAERKKKGIAREVKPYGRNARQDQVCQNQVGAWIAESYMFAEPPMFYRDNVSSSEHVFIAPGNQACNVKYMAGGSVQVNNYSMSQPQVVHTKPVQDFNPYAPAGNMCPENSQQIYPQPMPMPYQSQMLTYQQQPRTTPTAAYGLISQKCPMPSSYAYVPFEAQPSHIFLTDMQQPIALKDPQFHKPQTPPQELNLSPKSSTPDLYDDNQVLTDQELLKQLPPDMLLPSDTTSLETEIWLDAFIGDKDSFLGIDSPSSGYVSYKGDEDSSDALQLSPECVTSSAPVISNRCTPPYRAFNTPLEDYMAHIYKAGLVASRVEQDNVIAHRNCAFLTNEELKKLDDDQNSLLTEVAIKCSDTFLKPLLDRYVRSGLLPEFINKPNKQKRAPLHYVVHSNDPKKVRLLVEKGGDVNAENVSRIYSSGNAKFKKESLIGYVASQGEKFLSVLAELLCSPNADLSVFDSEGCTPLHTAIMSHNINGIDSRKTIWHLILRGANINTRNSLNSKTPLQCAVEKGDIVLVSHLFDVVRRVYRDDMGAKIRSMVQPGFSLLKAAFDLEFQDPTQKFYLIELLLKHGAELTQKSSDAALRKEFMQIPVIAEVMKSLSADKRMLK